MTTTRISDQDLERLVHGDNPESQELAQLAGALQTWQADFTRTPSEGHVAAFATQAAQIAILTKPEEVPQPTSAPMRSRFRALKYKLATGMAAVLMISGMSGVAVASDEAAPGDALYGIDRALEAVGINNGGAAERIKEAQALLEAGQTAEALEHATEALEDDVAAEAVSALMAAAERVRMNTDSEDTGDTLNSVADMLQAMGTAERGPSFAQMVTEMAKAIKGAGPEDAGPPSDLPEKSNGNPQGNNSQNSGEKGRGNQGNQGPPDSPPGQSGNPNPGRP